jgi:hypothetical protein
MEKNCLPHGFTSHDTPSRDWSAHWPRGAERGTQAPPARRGTIERKNMTAIAIELMNRQRIVAARSRGELAHDISQFQKSG